MARISEHEQVVIARHVRARASASPPVPEKTHDRRVSRRSNEPSASRPLLAKPHVSAIIVGAKNEQQLRDDLKASDLVLDPAELAELDAVSALPAEYPGWMIECLGKLGRAPKNAR